ncbi:hypothetical protein ACQKMN_14190 [Ureibacillus composti]
MLKKTVFFLLISFGCILLVGCNSEQNEKEVQEEINEVSESQEVGSPSNEGNNESSNLSEIKKQLELSINEQMAIDIEAIMLESFVDNENKEVSCTIVLSKEAKVEENTVQELIEVIVKTVSKNENLSISVDNIEISRNGEIIKEFNMN